VLRDRGSGAGPEFLVVHLLQVRFDTSIARNPIIYSNCAFAGLPFTGIGSGIPRALSLLPNIVLTNDQVSEKFVVTIPRPA